MQIVTIGLDLAKNVIQLHAVNQHGRAVLKKALKRDQVLPFLANVTPCLIDRDNEASKKLAEIPGIGPISASALVASIGDARTFKSGRELAAWLGLVPRQHSSGGKPTLLGISKRGDSYLRMLLIHGARSVLRVAERKADYVAGWLSKLAERRHHNVAAVALANKNARIIWALLAHDRKFNLAFNAGR